MMTSPARPASRRGWAWAWVLAAGVMAAAAVRAPGAAGDVRAAAAHLDGLRLAWLGVAVTAQGVALASGTAAQRQLLGAGGARLRWRTLFGLVLASTGLARVMPVLAGAAVLLAGGTAGLFVTAHRAHALGRWLSRRPHRSRAIARLTGAMPGLSRPRAGLGSAARVLACTGTGLLADAGVLAACFGLAGLPIPWRGVLFAYAAGQIAGRLVPLPGGIGGVEGGVLGALTLTGTPSGAAAAAVIVYRVADYWAVGAAGMAVAAALARCPRPDGTVVPVSPRKIPPPKSTIG
jgi:hypothetical protein